jgi:hypothetical protein
MEYPKLPLTVSASGFSEPFKLSSGYHWVAMKAASWGSATLQYSLTNEEGSYENAKKLDGTDIVITANWQYALLGGIYYRLNVTDYTAPISIDGRLASRSRS